MREVTDQQAELIIKWRELDFKSDAFEAAARFAGYDYQPGTYRKLKSRLTRMEPFLQAMDRAKLGKHPKPSKDEARSKAGHAIADLKTETLTEQVDDIKANKKVDSDWVLSEARRLYTLALADDKLPMAKQLLELIAKHKDVDAMANNANVQVNVFSDKAESLLIEGRKRVLESQAANQYAPPLPQGSADPAPSRYIPLSPATKRPIQSDVPDTISAGKSSPGCFSDSEKKIQSENGGSDGVMEEVI